MKIFITMLLLSFSLYAAHIDDFASEIGYMREYKSALELAKKENKILMLLVVGDYCPWCKKFERKTLKDSRINSTVQKEFISVVVDKFKDKGTYPDKYATPLIPTVFFIDPVPEKEILSTVGYMKTKEFAPKMDKAINIFKKSVKK